LIGCPPRVSRCRSRSSVKSENS